MRHRTGPKILPRPPENVCEHRTWAPGTVEPRLAAERLQDLGLK